MFQPGVDDAVASQFRDEFRNLRKRLAGIPAKLTDEVQVPEIALPPPRGQGYLSRLASGVQSFRGMVNSPLSEAHLGSNILSEDVLSPNVSYARVSTSLGKARMLSCVAAAWR